MSPVLLLSVVALFRSTLSSPELLFPPQTPTGAQPLSGLWAALPPDCAPPVSQKLESWPTCAVPLGFAPGEVAAIQRPDPDNPPPDGRLTAYAHAKVHTLAPEADGDPELVAVDIPLILNKTTLYIAVEPSPPQAGDGFGEAVGWPVACPDAPMEGVAREGKRCVATTMTGLRAAARLRPPTDKLYRLVHIPLGDPAGGGPSETAHGDYAAPETPPASPTSPAARSPDPAPPLPGAAPAAPSTPSATPPAAPQAGSPM